MLWSLLLEVVRAGLFGLTQLLGGNLGMGIIALSVSVRLCLLPWTVRAARRGLRMRERLKAIEPELQRLRRKHAHDPARLRSALFEQHRRAGVKPFSGLGVTAVQLPIGLALFSVIRGSLPGGRFLWVADLARPDVALSVVVGGVAVLAGLTAPSQSSAIPAAVACVSGVVSFLVVSHLSSGLALYWASSSGIGLLQNLLVRRRAVGP